MKNGLPEGSGRFVKALRDPRNVNVEKRGKRAWDCRKKKNEIQPATRILATCLEGVFSNGLLEGVGALEVGGGDLLGRGTSSGSVLYRGMVRGIDGNNVIVSLVIHIL